MKTKLFIIIVSFWLGLNAYSQLNYFLPDSNAYFSVSLWKFWFQGDTIIESKKYKKVFVQPGTPADFNQATYYASVREDTIREKIYCIQKDDGIERLIYDFSLNAGDTASIYSYWPFGRYPEKISIKVKNVDSIQIDGLFRKRINVHYIEESAFTDSWIEGIGSQYGLFYPLARGYLVDLGLPELLCVHLDNTIIYQTSNCCYKDILLGIYENAQHRFKVYPNPAKNILHVERDINSKDQIQYYIINNQGIIFEKGILPPDYIDISILDKGFYFILLFNDTKPLLYSTKFIKL